MSHSQTRDRAERDVVTNKELKKQRETRRLEIKEDKMQFLFTKERRERSEG